MGTLVERSEAEEKEIRDTITRFQAPRPVYVEVVWPKPVFTRSFLWRFADFIAREIRRSTAE